MTLDKWVYENAENLKKDIEISLEYGSPDNRVRLIMIMIRQWFEKRECINANKNIGTCIERCIVERIKAGEDYRQVFDDYGIKIK